MMEAMKSLWVAVMLMMVSGRSFGAKLKPVDHWVGTWATAVYGDENKSSLGTADVTLRQVVHVSLGGPLVRVELSNEFGTEPLVIGAAHVALSGGGSAIQLGTAQALTFGGQSTITIPPGATVMSDSAAMVVPALGNVTVSVFLPAQRISRLSWHWAAHATGYQAAGNVVGQASLEGATGLSTNVNWLFLKGLDVKTAPETGAVVAFGDSITDGTGSTLDANARWPDVLARRLQGEKKYRRLAVLNEGIGGNRLLHDGSGPSALARFDKDVLSRPGVEYLLVLEGINDIGHATDPRGGSDAVSAADLIQALEQLAERAHAHGIRVIGCTLTAYTGAGYASPAGEAMRQAYNDWIRHDKEVLDGFVDFDLVTADGASLKAADDSGDHLHPGDAGYRAMGDAVGLKMFSGKVPESAEGR